MKEESEENRTNSKVRPPFANLEIFNVGALILTYYGFDDEVWDLLQVLSQNARRYCRSHTDILKGFLIKWPSEAEDFMTFGGPDTHRNNLSSENRKTFPENGNIRLIQHANRVKLKEIRYKNCDNSEELCGIQLVFSN